MFDLYKELARLQDERETAERKRRGRDLPLVSETAADWFYVNGDAVDEAMGRAQRTGEYATIQFTPEDERKLAEIQLSRLDQPTTERLMARVEPDSDDFTLLYDHWVSIPRVPNTWWKRLWHALSALHE